MKYEKHADNSWTITDKGVPKTWPASSPQAESLSGSAVDGKLKKVEGKQKSPDEVLADPANEVYVNPGTTVPALQGKQYVKDPAGGWYMIKDDGSGNYTMNYYKPGTGSAADYSALAGDGGLVKQGVDKTEATKLLFDPANAVYTHADSPGVKYVKLPNGIWKVIQLSGKVLSYIKGGAGAKLAEEMILNGEFELLAAPGETASMTDAYGNTYAAQLIPTHVPFSNFVTSGSITASQVHEGTITGSFQPASISSGPAISVWDYNGKGYHSYAEELHKVAEKQEECFERVIKAQDDIIKLLETITPP